MGKFRELALWTLPLLGIALHIVSYVSTLQGNAYPNYFRFFSEGGFWPLLVTVILWLCVYLRASWYILLLFVILFAFAMGWGAWY
ncbi:hypothetical protein A3C19_01430 [Candidatus Kaiserbacteria bacterium RIFCSPHIGHO2_02_FULL_54_22]|uniref:Uncharacterized protein n=1 Tax=Candidatus Kaiserbacteria bacterium RIFCSPHIGHO2_02_FULL_54_22 TaxID=1798495 RepID=A0A1F6DKZ0_9BACT|nr:MAG: hypothetical protein A3C19_01430 [Candidatus Kaiserbacteria bacterium RIFCSPHIGHO2_02_FULL_54_22]OGG67818.1 MAG: hypothetical protein A3E99_01500 [Candidatus Kaiserbacteria bacterium RIFCSPHIGHO2_12_FULL_54_16]